jgi:RNA polymerase sigma-70 factor (ECF subfamily)
MAELSSQTLQLQAHLDRMRAGDLAARDELFRQVCGRLERLTRKMLKGFPGVKRWTQTDDVLQSALIRLLRALQEVRPASMREFFALTTEQIRRELLDLARHYYGPEGEGAHHASQAGDNSAARPAYDKPDDSRDPSVLAALGEFHQQVSRLPPDEREVVNLLFYQELTQAEAAEVLGVTVRTVQRRWQSALLKLHDILKAQWPGW